MSSVMKTDISCSNLDEQPKKKNSLHKALAGAQSGWLLEVIYFLSPMDASSYGATCKLALQLVSTNHIWDFYCTKYLSRVQWQGAALGYVQDSCLALRCPHPKALYTCLHKAKTSLLGWYHIVPSSRTEDLMQSRSPNGGLVCLRTDTDNEFNEKMVMLEIIDPNGRAVYQMKVKFSECRQKLLCYLECTGVFFLEFRDGGGINLKGLSGNESYVIRALPKNFQISKTMSMNYASQRSIVLNHVKCITGLYVANYGSHGLELIHMSLIENDERESDGLDSRNSEPNEPFYVINGLKVTGDPNVPAAQLSFTVDVTHLKDFSSWIEEDSRPVIFFSENGVIGTTLMSQRRNNIRGAYHGKGQINRAPGIWDPEWVDLTLVIYRDPLVANGASFSIVWNDVGESYRHLMDFSSFCGGKYPSLEVPVTWSSTK
jgi:hypothetical protein